VSVCVYECSIENKVCVCVCVCVLLRAKLSYAEASKKEESKLFYFSINGLCVSSSFMIAIL
jgi:hypothetical protein